MFRILKEGGSLTELEGKKSSAKGVHEPEPEVSDDEESYDTIITGIQAASDSINDLRERMTKLEGRIDELLAYLKGIDKSVLQASLQPSILRQRPRQQSIPSYWGEEAQLPL
jgi:hypothetical protein